MTDEKDTLQVQIGGYEDRSFAALIEALKRISALTPGAANAHTALDLHYTVKAIADEALSRREARSNIKREETAEEAHERMMRGDLR
jgi:hypothetical protein